jgi:hypothetical protein
MEAQAPQTVARGKVITDRWHTREQKPASKEVMADLDSFDLPLAAMQERGHPNWCSSYLLSCGRG